MGHLINSKLSPAKDEGGGAQKHGCLLENTGGLEKSMKKTRG